MSDQQEYIKMKKELTLLKAELTKYQTLFESDGHVDTEEQRKLNAMQAIITKAEQKLETLLRDSFGDDTPINWVQLKKDYEQDVESWITKAQLASQEVFGYITARAESKDGSPVVGTLLTIIGSYGPQYTIAVEIMKAAANSMKSKPVATLSDFHSSWKSSLEDQRAGVDFQKFKAHFDTNYSATMTSHAQALEIMENYLEEGLMPPKEVQKTYIRSWIDSAEDETNWLGFNDHDDKAGYIRIDARYQFPVVTIFNTDVNVYKAGLWFQDDLHIDDMARPEGTNNALSQIYGKDKTLVSLPFSIEAIVQVTVPNGIRSNMYPYHGVQKYSKAPGQPWKIIMGDQKILDLFVQDFMNKKTVHDLGVE